MYGLLGGDLHPISMQGIWPMGGDKRAGHLGGKWAAYSATSSSGGSSSGGSASSGSSVPGPYS